VSIAPPILAESQNMRLGLRFKPHPSSSGNDTEIRRISVRYSVAVEALSLQFADWSGSELDQFRQISGGAVVNGQPYLAVALAELPPEDISNRVYSVVEQRLDRNIVITNALIEVPGTNYWRSETGISPAFESGETVRYQALLEFESASGLPDLSPSLFPFSPFETIVPGLGGVWINELTDSAAELAAPIGRETQTGWQLVFENNGSVYTQVLSAVSFTNNSYRGLAFEVVEFDVPLVGALLSGSVYLFNSADIIEHNLADYVVGGGDG
jgi:hypothetical protein